MYVIKGHLNNLHLRKNSFCHLYNIKLSSECVKISPINTVYKTAFVI